MLITTPGQELGAAHMHITCLLPLLRSLYNPTGVFLLVSSGVE